MRITVFGLWHLGCVTAACLAQSGHRVTGLDFDAAAIDGLTHGEAPLHEPGLNALIAQGLAQGALQFTTDARAALADAEVVWVTFDTPVNEQDEADVAFVRGELEKIAPYLAPGTLILISSQAPAGFTASLERDWAGKNLQFAYSPENLRLGKAIEVFTTPERVIAGMRDAKSKSLLEAIFLPYTQNIVWMSVESAEMTKHALNAFLATSVTFANELARLCEVVGADAKEVERGLKSEARIGPKAYLAPGAAYAGGTLARDVQFLIGFGRQFGVDTPFFKGVAAGNERHKQWLRDTVARLVAESRQPVIAVLGLTYKAGTDTLRRSSSIELCRWLHEQGLRVLGHDPAVKALPDDLKSVLELCETPQQTLNGADLAVIATEWPEFRSLTADDFAGTMRRAQVIDTNWFLSSALAGDARIAYVAPGRRGSHAGQAGQE